MKVLILSTYETAGGAAIAANRLLHALRKNGVEATMLCRKNLSWWKGKPQSWTSIIERGLIWAASPCQKSSLWAKDIALLGQDITKTEEYRQADVIHLHWVNQGFISLKAIEGFLRDGKRVVWTMHDAWNAMGAYHLKLTQQDDWLERMTWRRKEKLYASKHIQFVTCSQWLRREAIASTLMADQNVVAIPNPLDIDVFKPIPHEHKRRVLFVAQNVNNVMKGIQYLNEAMEIINDDENENENEDEDEDEDETAAPTKTETKTKTKDGNIEVIALGRDIPYISDVKEMARLYASVDAFVLPSLSENLPNTIMEAMACGTPCVGFDVGGIPEMIDHKVNGYLARYKDAKDLAEGIRYVLDSSNHQRLAAAARQKIIDCYSEKAVAERYIEVYKKS